MKSIFTCVVVSSILFLSCRTSKKNIIEYRNMDTISISAYNNPMSIYRASAPKLWNIIHTRAALNFDFKSKTASGQEWVILEPYFYATDTLCLDAKGMKIESVSIGHNDKPLVYKYDSSQLHIKLDRLYQKGEQVKLSIKYVALPYAQSTGGSEAITDDRGLYFINTDNKIEGKPLQIWTQGETESNSHWLPTIDKPNMRSTVQLELTVPIKYTTLSNGELISSMEKGMMRTDIWKMDKPIQVYAIMFAIGEFAVKKDKWQNKEVNYYVEPEYAPFATKMFQYTPEMIEFFSSVTGVPYPWNKYSQVVVRDYVSGAMENTSASLFGEFMNQNAREYADANHEDVVSHELFHQWFGDYVTAESWSNLTVNESFATYGEYLWRKHKYGLSYADELAWSDLQKYLNYTEYSDPVLVRHHYSDKEEMFDRVSYQKGGAILHYLHSIMGDSAFYQSMKLYLSKNALQAAEAAQWRLAIEEATGQDWNWFFNEWYLRAGHPILDVTYNYDDASQKLSVTVAQTQDASVGLYHLPLKTLIINGSQKSTVDWNITKKKETFIYNYQNGVAPVLVPDVTHVLPGVILENKTYKQYLVQMDNCDDFVSQLIALQSIKPKDIGNVDVQAILNKGINNKTASLRETSLEIIKPIENESWRNKFLPDVLMLATNDGNNSVRAAALEILGKWKIKEQKPLMLDALKDSSYLVGGNALLALYQVDDTLGYQWAKKMLDGKPNTNLDAKVWAIIADKASDTDTSLFKTACAKKSLVRNYLYSEVAAFANNTHNEKSFSVLIKLLQEKIANTELKNQRVNYVSLLSSIQYATKMKLQKDKKNTLYTQKLSIIKSTVSELNANEHEKDVLKIYQQILK